MQRGLVDLGPGRIEDVLAGRPGVTELLPQRVPEVGADGVEDADEYAEAFVERLAQTGACGLIVPDLPQGEEGEVRAACEGHGLALVPLVAPTTDPERLRAIGARAMGFLYTVSVVGTTGERDALAESLAAVIARAKASTEVPVALGFGISTPEQARRAAEAGADGVIVGTRLVRAAGASRDPAGAVGALVGELAAGLAPTDGRSAS